MKIRSIALLLALVAAPVLAQDADPNKSNFPVERFRPAIDGNGMLDVEWGQVGSHLDANLSLIGNYNLNPLVLVRRKDGEPVDRIEPIVAQRGDLNLSGAISLFNWIQLGVDLPLTVLQSREPGNVVDSLAGADLRSFGLGDLRIVPKIRLLKSEDAGVDLAIMPTFTLPTSNAVAKGNYFGEGQFTILPELLVSRRFDSGLKLAANLGYRYRPEERTFLNATIGHEVLLRAGAGYRLSFPLEIDLTANAGTYVFKPFTSGIEENPLEVIAGASYEVLPWLKVTGGVGKGIFSGVGVPDWRFLLGLRLQTPTGDDKDGDGILDADDKCVDQPEDEDEWQDEDGCPDPDDDNDGVLDVDDRCRRDPEDKDGYQDEDGCADPDNDGDGVLDDADLCPTEQGSKENNGCPIKDSDKDGILDADDACVNTPGLKTLNGCPDKDGDGITDAKDACVDVPGLKQYEGCPDTDGDGFPDSKDKCPKEPEVINGLDDEDGCPDKGKSQVKLTGEKIEILDKVYFDVNKDTIQKRSFGLLDQVASILKTHPELTKVRIEGHTDSDGSDAANQDLSDRRAKAVKRYISEHNVDAGRLDGQGFGESRPVVPNTSKKNKEQNRRVEFVIVEMNGKAVEGTATIKTKDAEKTIETPAKKKK
jgi:outer membrane protein OmpA-like peptidoglycan-associated protein